MFAKAGLFNTQVVPVPRFFENLAEDNRLAMASSSFKVDQKKKSTFQYRFVSALLVLIWETGWGENYLAKPQQIEISSRVGLLVEPTR